MAAVIPMCLCFSLCLFSLVFQACTEKEYDYSYTHHCMPEPAAPQYGGGIAVNPEFDEGLEGWVGVGNAELAWGRSPSGNNYAEVSLIVEERSDGASQFFSLDKENYYMVSAWFQARGKESVDVQAKLVASTGNQTAGWTTAKCGCWSMLKGGLSGNVTEVVELRFEANTTGADIWMDSVSLQSFTKEEWTLHQVRGVDKVRKSRVGLHVAAENGTAEQDAAISIKQLEPHFPFGNVMNGLIIENRAYQNWFLEKGFRYTVFENELKWQHTEKYQGFENYTDADSMLEFCKVNNLSVRGHNLLWDDERYQENWMKNLTDKERRRAALKRVETVVERYSGDFIHWDVLNENLHYDFFSRVVGGNGVRVFKMVHDLDPHPIPFLNDFNVVEATSIFAPASPLKYLKKIEQLRCGGYDGPLGIGVESHFDVYSPNVPYVRAAIDMLASTGLPIWITEFTINTTVPDQPQLFELLLHDFHSHPAVNGMILWSSVGSDDRCYSMCLTDHNYKNLPSGDIVDRFMAEFIHVEDTKGRTDVDGMFEATLFYGEYEATVTLSNGATRTLVFNLLPHQNIKDEAIIFNVS